MKKVLIIIFALVSIIGQGQNSLIRVNDKNMGTLIGGMPELVNMGTAYQESVVYASSYGFSPDSSATANVVAWNSMPDNKTIRICDTGNYDIDSALLVKSNTSYEFCSGISITKTADFSHFFLNKNAANGTVRDSNITIIGNGVKLIPNGHDYYSATTTPVPRLRGQFQLYKVDDFNVSDININDTTVVNQFAFVFTDCSQGVISDLDIRSDKDGLDLIASNNIDVSNCKIYTRDDAVFVGVGYAIATPVLKDSYNITFTNMEIGSAVAEQGFAFRFYSGSWDTWDSGTNYSDYAYVNYGGRTYAKGTAGTQAGTVAPVHTSGSVLGADGITWWFVQDSINSSVDVYGVTVDGFNLTSDRAMCDMASIYVAPGTERQGTINNIYFNDVTVKNSYQNSAFYYRGYVDSLYVNNLIIDFDSATTNRFIYSVAGVAGLKHLKYLNIDNSTINANGTYFIYLANANDSIEHIKIDSTTMTLAGSYFINSGTGAKFDRVDFTNCDLSSQASRFIRLRTNVLPVINFTDCYIHNIERLVGTDQIATSTVTLTNCIFATPLAYVCPVQTAGSVVNLISTGTHYVDPTGYLFYTNQAAGSLNINVSNSTGTVTQSKVRNSASVTVTACDLPYL